MKEETSSFAETLKSKRKQYGISQERLAVMASLPRQYISEVETGKTIPPADKQKLIAMALEKLNPEAPLTMLIDYVRIRFPTTDVKHIVHGVLKLKLDFMLHEEY
ncbi:helix-turn-helix domain-containing protein, partial [Candidatus Stoquefichus massiliensis]|uniref:helix-turn-helix domain-containing protein n=1 Tax=Candidatus Stoquefichus massiliensis TaxID=1470350 RepID=UPI00047FBF84